MSNFNDYDDTIQFFTDKLISAGASVDNSQAYCTSEREEANFHSLNGAEAYHDNLEPPNFPDQYAHLPTEKPTQPTGKNRQAVKTELGQLRTNADRKPFFTSIGELTAKPTPTEWLIKDYLNATKPF